MQIRFSGIVNYIAGLTFGIYLFHEDYYLREGLWQQVFRGARFADSPYLIPYIIFQVAAVFITGSVIELIRQLTEKFCAGGISRALDTMQKRIDEVLCQK